MFRMLLLLPGLLISLISSAQQDRKIIREYRSLNIQIQYGTGVFSLKKEKGVSGRQEEVGTYSCAELPFIRVDVRSVLHNGADHYTVVHDVNLTSDKRLDKDLTIFFPVNAIQHSSELWYPLKNGIGKTINSPTEKNTAMFRCAGRWQKMESDLALPLAVYTGRNGKYAVMTDPFFSSMFGQDRVYWTYPKEVGLEDKVEKRTIAETVGVKDPDDAISRYYQTILKDIPPGPAWIKDIAMVTYDYMSDGGAGWFRDIDSMAKAFPAADRKKMLLTLHGWYDFVGRYCFNTATGKLDEAWHNRLMNDRLTLADLHTRIRYAKDRGFKVALYFADGIISGDKLEDYDPEKTIPGSGWNGPDVLGNTYRRNISCKEYYDFYINYARALFKEFASEVDMFVWDETFYISAGHLGTEKHRSYLDRTFMRLVKEITGMLHQLNPEVAFVTSDLIGPQNTFAALADVPPYSLVADGTYQDSGCHPDYWSYGIFPNYRNVLWSCNWWAASMFKFTVFGVMEYQAPVALSNGWEDNKGFSEMTPAEKNNCIRLFNYRKSFSTQLKWLQAIPPFIDNCISR